MDTQKNLMMFSIIISVVYGIWAIFAPGSIIAPMVRRKNLLIRLY